MIEQKIITHLKNALKKDHLYTDEELSLMKKELKNLQEYIQTTRKLSNKGFGN